MLPEADQQILRDLMSDAMEEIDMQQASTPVGSQTNGEKSIEGSKCHIACVLMTVSVRNLLKLTWICGYVLAN